MFRKSTILFLILLIQSFQLFGICNKSGVYKIGPGGAYTTLTTALNDLKNSGTSGPVIFELKSNYSSSGETYPLTFNNIPCISSANTVTIRPEAGATGLVLQTNGMVISLAMSRYIIIDGRPGGVGTVGDLQISGGANLSTIGFYNDASNNVIQYVYVTGSVSNANSGVISFTTSNQSITNGNNDNIISNCIISGNGSSVNCIYSSGSAGKKNFGNKISNCNIVGFETSNPVTPASAVKLMVNNMFWMIDSNNIYVPSTISLSACIPVCINDTTSNAFYVRGNYIGGSAPQCGGTAVSYYGNSFTGIYMACSKTGFSNIQGNTIANINWSNQLTQQYFAGIHIAAGVVRCGTITGNTIGSMTQNYSIVSNSYYLTSPEVYGILVYTNWGTNGSLDSVQIKNNFIGGINCLPGTNSTNGTFLKGIAVLQQQDGHVSISNNTIGSTTLEKSLYSTLSTFSSDYATTGIYVQVAQNGGSFSTYNISNIISNNLVQHLYGQVRGINVEGGTPLIKSNVIKNIADGDTGSVFGNAVIVGIEGTLLTTGALITENRIFNCKLYGVYAASVNGVVIDNSEGVEISKNLIHTFKTEGDYIPTVGIAAYASSFPYHGKHRIYNNMIRFGVDSSGNVINQSMEISGIVADFDSCFISHNSIYITGSGDADTRAIYIRSSVNNFARITNNIFVNQRMQIPVSNTFRNTGIGFDNVFTVPLAGLSISNNIYHIATGTNNNYVVYNNTPFTTLTAWQQYSGLDNNSLTGNPSFINPNGDVSTVNLHIALNSIADMAGIAEPAVTLDFDNEVRALLTPVDIGADAPNPNPTAIENLQVGNAGLLIYPNPVQDLLNVEFKFHAITQLRVLDAMGKEIFKTKFDFPVNEYSLNTENFKSGIYFVEVSSENIKAVTRFVKQ